MGTLARLQEWLDSQVADADDAVCAQIDGLSPDQQRFLLRAGVDRIEAARPLFGTPAGDDLLYSVGGLTELLYLSVRRGDRGFTRKDAAGLYWKLDAAGHRKLVWTIWGGAAPVAASDDDGGDEPESAPFDWWGVWHALMGEPYGFTPKQILSLTWPQVVCALGDGKPLARRPRFKTFEEHQAHEDRRRSDPWAV